MEFTKESVEDRNKKIRKRFVDLRKFYSVGRVLDILQDEYKLQFDTIRSIVYKGGVKNLFKENT